MLLLDTNILIDVLRGEAVALAWLEQQQRPRISVITWIEVLVGCRDAETEAVQAWLEVFPRLPLDDASSRCAELTLATRNSRDFPLTMGGVLHPYMI
jgi:predicted nucleic acid-binding protein